MNASRFIKLISITIIAVLIIIAVKSIGFYKKVFAPSVNIKSGTKYILFIKTGSTYDSVYNLLKEAEILRNYKGFDWTAKRKNYPVHIYPGRYLLKHRMSNNQLVNLLRSGSQEPVDLRFNNIRTLDEFSIKISEQLELNASELLEFIKDSSTLLKYNFNKHTIACMFIPNTYQIYWNITTEEFLERMNSEYNSFWNKSRQKKAQKIGLKQEEVISLASIVNRETVKDDEKKKIAGVYMNRINTGMRLQADPTIIFAHNDFSIRRVLKKHKKINSPFNTYKYAGLPPGPICLPDIKSIDAVLNYQKHKYIYFCAKPDFSGYHNFARTYAQHSKNARAYQRELNKRRIYR